MVLYNASKKSRNVASLVTINQGGGDKKAGLPYIVGRTAYSSMFLSRKTGGCELEKMKIPESTTIPQSRPISSTRMIPRFSMRL